MIVSRLVSGLGNQLFQYTVGRQLSYITGMPLKLDCRAFLHDRIRKFGLDKFNIIADIANNKDIDDIADIYTQRSLLPFIYRRLEGFIPKYKKRIFKESDHWRFESQLFSISSPVYLYGYWQHYQYYQNLHPNLMKELTLREEVVPNNVKIIDEIINDQNSISIHVRRGDYFNNDSIKEFHGLLPLKYYHDAVFTVSKNIHNPNFYVFSDDLSWVEKNLKLNHNMILVDIENGEKDYLELYAMSKCRHNIIANSTFSWWGAFLNSNTEKIVIGPSKWVNDKKVNSKIQIQIPSWILQ